MTSKNGINEADVVPNVFPSKRRRITRASLDSPSHDERKLNRPGCVEFCCGLIERIVLKDFMCHESLELDFTEKINLIQGSNGSGKSAIVTAIVAGLGGISHDKKNMESLIMHNKKEAIIELHLQNKGSCAYKPDMFGDVIIVERTIQAKRSMYKIKSKEGHLVFDKQKDLVHILDSFNLSIDNPVLVLTQEKAKTFLSATKPKDLFKFYMLATNLEQLKTDYKEMSANLASSDRLVKEKKQNIPLHKKEVKEWETKVNAINSLEHQRAKVMDLRREKAWAEVRDVEAKLEKVQKEDEQVQKQLDELFTKINTFILEKEDLNKEMRECVANLESLAGKVTTFEEEKKEAFSSLNTSKKRFENVSQRFQSCLHEKENKSGDIEIIRRKLATDHHEAQLKYHEKVNENNELKTKLGEELNSLQKCFDAELKYSSELPPLDDIEIELEQLRREKEVIEAALSSLERELRNLKNGGDSLILFGQMMPDVIREVEMSFKRGVFHHCPIGPLGAHIKVRERQWAHIAESVLGNILKSFLVSNNEDLRQLKGIFSRHFVNDMPEIIVSPRRNQLHDVGMYEAISPSYYSLWSILETEDIQVGNVILDQYQVESILLIPTSLEAGELLMNQQTVPKNCKKAYTVHGDIYFPDPNYRIYSGNGDKSTQYLQISVDEKKRDLDSNIRETRKAVETSKKEYDDKFKHKRQTRESHLKSTKFITSIKQNMDGLRERLVDLANTDISAPPDVVQLEDDLQEYETQLKDIKKRHVALSKEVTECVEVRNECQLKYQAMTNKRVEFDEESGRLQKEHENYMSKHVIIGNHVAVCNRQRKELKQNILSAINTKEEEIEKQLKAKLEVLQLSNLERIDTMRSVESIERDLATLASIISRQERQQGNLEVVSATWREKKDTLKRLEREVEIQSSYITKLRETLQWRNELFDTLLKFQDAYMKSSFEKKLASRNILGGIQINYQTQELKILTRMNANSGNQPELKSLQMMSGGERSFATVSFILALWDIVYAPVRILDEFDIFMDVVLRKQAFEMLVDSIQQKYQYILVTPLDYNFQTDAVKTYRMHSPKRKGP